VDRHRWWALALAALVSVITLVALFLVRMASAWCWTSALLGLGRRYLTASRLPGPLLGYAREASYPIYTLHQTVIFAIKYVAILVAGSVGTLLIYHFLVRRICPVRFLFEMKAASIEEPLSRRGGAAAHPQRQRVG
jgi:hypothetical protein